MREIKVRGYAVEEMVNSQWVYGTGVHTTKFTKEFAEEAGKSGETFVFTESGGWIEVYPESVGQYTGLKDKNDKEIYEGDIVKTHDQNNVIEYKHGSFLVKGLHADEYERTYSVLYHYLVDATIPDMPHSKYDGVTTTLEIIGNIYENPELLEGTA